MFDITAAASAATTPGPNLAKSPGLKPKEGCFPVYWDGESALWQGWRAGVHFSSVAR